MFNEICIYEAKPTKLDEIEELMKEVAEFYLEQEGVIDVDDSNYCIFYYNDSYSPRGAVRSGTRIAYDYAKRVEKRKQSQLVVINIFP